ncbi:hypothetical protein QVD17_37959 [Tagetes erecta]|uniref:Uncharacterized protein n=1 Tax=Tagetes erecta TaxID=13708 RepID=A0AAD8JUZ2_TARER|nr:hypothetical protein QVD17_37959 [Tagetes erecta]
MAPHTPHPKIVANEAFYRILQMCTTWSTTVLHVVLYYLVHCLCFRARRSEHDRAWSKHDRAWSKMCSTTLCTASAWSEHDHA